LLRQRLRGGSSLGDLRGYSAGERGFDYHYSFNDRALEWQNSKVTKKLSQSDFRAVRVVLEPEDFALGSDEPDPPPSDLISEKAWHGMSGPAR